VQQKTKGSRLGMTCKKLTKPTLKLLQVNSFDIATSKILHMGDQGVGILPGAFREPRNEVLEVRVGPGVAC
jgi:hypothetical protein